MRIAKEEKLSGLENHKYHAQKIRYPCNIINYTMPNKIAFITCQTYVLFVVGKNSHYRNNQMQFFKTYS